MQTIMPCLWFDDKAEEAMRFYVSIFKSSRGARARVIMAPKGIVKVRPVVEVSAVPA